MFKLNIRILLTLVAMLQVSVVFAAETITYFHNDALGSPVAATDENGNVLWREAYEPYGNRIRKEDNGTNDTWYTGKQEDKATGLSYFGARWYDPTIGRFMGIDPVGYQEGNIHSFNRYAYANNNPYRFVDPDGNEGIETKSRTIIHANYNKPTGKTKMYEMTRGTDRSSKGILEAAGLMQAPTSSPYKKVHEGAAVDIAKNIANGVGSVDYESKYKIYFPMKQYEASKYIEDTNSNNPSEKTWVGPIKTKVWRPDPNGKPTKINSEQKAVGTRYWFKPKAK